MSDDEGDVKAKTELKVVLIGEAGVGKTSIIKQFVNNEFDPEIESSISSNFTSKTIKIEGIGKAIKFDLWDTAGQERYRSLAKIFYKDSKIIIFVYEVTSKKTFKSLKEYWYEQIKVNSLPDTILVLVANKSDLYNKAQVEEKEGQEWADSIGAIFQSTSAKNNSGIEVLFQNIGKKFFNPDFDYKSEDNQAKKNYDEKKNSNKKKNDEEEDDVNNEPKIVLTKEATKKTKGKKCC